MYITFRLFYVVVVIALVSNRNIVLGWTMMEPSTVSKATTSAGTSDRRVFFTNTITTIAGRVLTTAAAAVAVSPTPAFAKGIGSKDSVVQREINTFNSLIYNFKNTALDGGLDAKTLTEPSITFIEFGEAMKKGQVTFVEFLAPNGLVAYATLKKNPKKPIRIGQGYPTGAKNSWSSPDFVIRSVSNYGVPYKFTVPALEKYNKRSKA
jgi:hypothetical protein